MFVLDLRNDLLQSETTADLLLERARSAYLGMAIGDALGATVEFLTPREIQTNHGVHRDIVGGGWLHLRKGRVTDDTEMSLALGESLLRSNGVDAADIAEAFSDWMRSKPVDIGHTVRRGVSRYRRTGESAVPENEYDAGNGACMRVLPIALFTLGADPRAVAEACRIQAHVTHHNELSDAGTQAVVRMVQTAILGGTREHLLEVAQALIAAHERFAFDLRRTENPSGFIVDTLRAVFQALFDNVGFEDSMIDVVNRGGDADTTGAILGMIAGPLYGSRSFPRRWMNTLNKDSARACREQADALLNLSPRLRAA